MKKTALMLALTGALSACSDLPLARDYALAGMASDVSSTLVKLGQGCHETNPIYFGKGMGQKATLVGINLLMAAGVWWAADNLDPDEDGVTIPFWLVGSVRFAAAGYNMSLKC